MLDRLERVQACLLGVRIGDALGQPVETMTRQQILEAVVPGKRKGEAITRFYPAIQERIRQTATLQAGDTTDDWQLTEVVAQSYCACRGFNSKDMIDRHIAALKATTTGWGRGSQRSIEDIVLWQQTNGEQGRNPDEPLPPPCGKRGAGNGVAMKIAPLALFHGLRSPQLDALGIYHDVAQLARLTHPDPRSFFAAYALALVITDVLRNPIQDLRQSRALLEKVIWYVREQEEQSHAELTDTSASAVLALLRDRLGDTERIFQDIGPGFLATESVMYAIGVFLSIPTDFKQAVLTAVNDGGDSDSTASMIGGMVGANCGLASIPVSWQCFGRNTSRVWSSATSSMKRPRRDSAMYGLFPHPG